MKTLTNGFVLIGNLITFIINQVHRTNVCFVGVFFFVGLFWWAPNLTTFINCVVYGFHLLLGVMGHYFGCELVLMLIIVLLGRICQPRPLLIITVL